MQPLSSSSPFPYRIPGIRFRDQTAKIDKNALKNWIGRKEENIHTLAKALLLNREWTQNNREVIGKIFDKLDKSTLKPNTVNLIKQVNQLVKTTLSDDTVDDISPLLTETNIANFLGDVFILNEHGTSGKLEGSSVDHTSKFIAAVLERVDTDGHTRNVIQG